MKIAMVVMLLACGAACGAQTAQVIPLSHEDALEAKTLYAQQKDIEQRIEALRTKIVKDYDQRTAQPSDEGRHFLRNGTLGFEFSADFKYIVPSQTRPASVYGMYGCATPAVTHLQNPVIDIYNTSGSHEANPPGKHGSPHNP